ncbi:DUF6916 family protein [Flavisolibacter ginsenosidimutans]|uniref:DUF6916 domain-containing protein n=1 Tax=Flavisolibacter ginsenosidimutans TaxID=661481 RepID=A0A5B8UNI7_9BACT|nr:hypothetical protein [Flavisolibacter ginsenosidimutans]QEC57932.1 hypothetical protein FSB75_19145 [Flavisolibacter ginsenosidimutans]
MEVALQLLTASDFQSQVSKDFSIHFPNEVATAQLVKVVEMPPYANVERKPFSILLQTTQKDHYYQQAIYTIEQPALGSMQIFLVPVECNEAGMQYEAVFS